MYHPQSHTKIIISPYIHTYVLSTSTKHQEQRTMYDPSDPLLSLLPTRVLAVASHVGKHFFFFFFFFFFSKKKKKKKKTKSNLTPSFQKFFQRSFMGEFIHRQSKVRAKLFSNNISLINF